MIYIFKLSLPNDRDCVCIIQMLYGTHRIQHQSTNKYVNSLAVVMIINTSIFIKNWGTRAQATQIYFTSSYVNRFVRLILIPLMRGQLHRISIKLALSPVSSAMSLFFCPWKILHWNIPCQQSMSKHSSLRTLVLLHFQEHHI